jgi:uncharacterized protein (TIGR03437 family)
MRHCVVLLFLASLATPLSALPVIASVSNAASFIIENAVSPGELATIMGVGLAVDTASATGFPLPLTLQGASVEIGGVAAPLLYVSPTQINFQVPYDLPQSASSIVVGNGVQKSAALPVRVVPVTPGIFTLNGNYTAPFVVHTSDYSLATAQNPARAGESLAIYCTGLGATNPPATAGAASAGLAPITGTVQIMFGSSYIPATYGFRRTIPGQFPGSRQCTIRNAEHLRFEPGHAVRSVGGSPCAEQSTTNSVR